MVKTIPAVFLYMEASLLCMLLRMARVARAALSEALLF
jgi:hypothetical protein